MRTLTLAACTVVLCTGAALAQGTAITPAQSLANQPGAVAPPPPAAAAPVEAKPRAARKRKSAAKRAPRP